MLGDRGNDRLRSKRVSIRDYDLPLQTLPSDKALPSSEFEAGSVTALGLK